ncbi:MAG: hypothetical protein MUF22_06490 [Chitinispirillaceae bacterium]|nr:hypothetical protein [Chitinispirillaceae bacterium]
MGCEIISIQTEDSGKPVLGLLNWKLNDELTASSSAVILSLPAALKCDMSLLEFLADWNRRFTNANKQLFFVPGDRFQQELLEVSHPDLALQYAPSLAELKQQQPALFEEQDKFPDSEKQRLPARNPSSTGETDRYPVIVAGEGTPVAAPVTVAVSDVLTTSGEYACLTCRKTRMWMKGEVIGTCKSAGCSGKAAGWELTFELF